VYSITFYSFKGGVGRTLAVVNIGVELARTGRKVLLVDFDLEAPGVDTFDELRPPEPHPGVVDYVTDYLQTGQPQDASQYIYEAHLEQQRDQEPLNGKLWVMPAGRQDESYSARLTTIDWQHLYAEKEGFLLFEDLKVQWEEKLSPDYVLIDSRTGHTEVGGICTRQLPDAVVLLFFPNRQNLEGLRNIVSAIRKENAARERARHIHLEFVASNVPYLDDEEGILRQSMRAFARELGMDNSSIIHRYDSLHLVDQAIFVLKRPKSRLSKQYKSLLRELALENVKDRLGAIDYLRRQLRVLDTEIALSPDDHDRIEAILEHHSQDTSVCFHTALLYKKLNLHDKAISCFENAIALARQQGETVPPQALLDCAESRLDDGDKARARDEILEALQNPALPPHEIGRAVRLLQLVDESAIPQAVVSPTLRKATTPVAVHLTDDLMTSRGLLKVARQILVSCAEETPPHGKEEECWRNQLAICLIGLREFDEVVRLLGPRLQQEPESIADTFNYAMASWGATGQVPRDSLQRVVKLDEKSERDDANYEQCLALTFALLGRAEEAGRRIENSRRRIARMPLPTFSCWRYLVVAPDEFRKDLAALELASRAGEIVPDFLR